MRNSRIVLTALLAAGVGGQAHAGTIEWDLSGCAQQNGNQLLLANCDPAICQYATDAVASFAPSLPGTLSLQLDWSVGDNSYNELLSITTSAGLIFSLAAPPGEAFWCTPTPCSGSVLIETHLAAADMVKIRLFNWSDDCTGKVTCEFHFDFVPDPGIGAGVGELDRRLIAAEEGEFHFESLGLALDFPGDFDGDGVGDIAASGSGYVRVFSSASSTKPIQFWTFNGGSTLASAGDVDGDGVPDLVVGAPGVALPQVAVQSGVDGHVLLTLAEPLPGELFGSSVSGPGDLDGDGLCDVLVGAPASDLKGTDSGATRAYSGASGALLFEVPGRAAFEYAGTSVAGVGDETGDGVPDFVVGVPFAKTGGVTSGVARVHSGADGLQLAQLPGPAQDLAQFGHVVARGGDIDADGVEDVLVGAPLAMVDGHAGGQVLAFSGATHALLFMLGGEPYEILGNSMSPAGDFDGDGHGDVLVGIDGVPGIGDDVAAVVSGATQEALLDLSLAPPFVVTGPYFSAGFGSACAGGSDVDGDGRADFAVGAPHWEGLGKVFVYSGDPADWVPPSLTGTGTLQPSSPLDLAIGAGDPDGAVFLVVGSTSVHVPFKGGLLMPAPDVLVPFVLDAVGALQIATTWPAGVPSGASIWLQAWLPDEEGIAGFVATASLSLTAP